MSKEKELKYGVSHFAKEAGVEDATARVMLRSHNIKKAGKSYGWSSMNDVKAAVAKCRSGKKPAKTEKKAPAKKKVKKAAPKKKPAARKKSEPETPASE